MLPAVLCLRRVLFNGCGAVCNSLRHTSTASGHAKEEYSKEKETHFGFESVSEEKKAEKVHQVFENVADKYDLMNDLMSGFIHRVWKDQFVSRLHPTPNTKLLDVAGGTGDIVFRYIQHLQYENRMAGRSAGWSPKHTNTTSSTTTTTTTTTTTSSDSDTSSSDSDTDDNQSLYKISVCDISESMLSVGERRAEALGHHGINWVCGDAQKLPFDDCEFDCYTIAFGIRNVVDVQKALDEAYRVLKPGGRFMCLEFSHVNNPALRWVYDQYSFNVIPPMGQVVAGDWNSYQYLVQSIRKFPDQETFKEMIEESGFRSVTYENLTFGVAAIHSGFKI